MCIRDRTNSASRLSINSSGKVIIGNSGTPFGNAAVQAFIQHGNTAGESGFSSVDTTSVAAGVGGEIAFHGKYNTGAQDWAYFGHIRGIKENATNGNTACALTFHTRPDATAPQERLRIASNGAIGLSGANYGSSGQVLTSQGSGSPVQWATPSSVTTTSGTMTIGFQDHTSGNTSSTTATGRYERIGNMVHCSIDTGSINKSGLNSGQILLLTGCFPITRDNNWHIAGSTYHYNVNTSVNGGGHQVVAAKGYWLSNTSMYFVIPRNNSTSDNLTVGMMSGNNARFFMNYSYKVN